MAFYHPQETRAAKSSGRWGAADCGKKLVRNHGALIYLSLPTTSNLELNQQLTMESTYKQKDKDASDLRPEQTG